MGAFLWWRRRKNVLEREWTAGPPACMMPCTEEGPGLVCLVTPAPGGPVSVGCWEEVGLLGMEGR